MSENMMCSAHKSSTPASREGWERIFGMDRDYFEQEYPEENGDFAKEYCQLKPITKQPETKVFKPPLNQLGTLKGYGRPPLMKGAIKR